jgi:hypothetical protein
VNLFQTKIWRIQYKYFHSENQHGIALFLFIGKKSLGPKVWVASPKMYSLWQKDAPSYAYNSEVNSPSFKSEKKKKLLIRVGVEIHSEKRKKKNNIGGKIIIQNGSV